MHSTCIEWGAGGPVVGSGDEEMNTARFEPPDRPYCWAALGEPLASLRSYCFGPCEERNTSLMWEMVVTVSEVCHFPLKRKWVAEVEYKTSGSDPIPGVLASRYSSDVWVFQPQSEGLKVLDLRWCCERIPWVRCPGPSRDAAVIKGISLIDTEFPLQNNTLCSLPNVYW